MTDKGNPASDEEQKKAEKNLDDELRRISEKSNDLLSSLDSTGKTIRDISQPSSVKANANLTSQVKNSSLDGKPLGKKQITSEGIYRDTSEPKKSFSKVVLILFASIGVIAGLAIYQEGTTSAYLLAQAQALVDKKGSEQEVIRLAGQVLSTRHSSEAYFYRAYAKDDLGDKEGAIADYNQAIAINPKDDASYFNRALVKTDLGDKQGAIADYNQAIAINPKDDVSYLNRGIAKSGLGDEQGACLDYKKAVSLGDTSTSQWLQSNEGAWCRDIP